MSDNTVTIRPAQINDAGAIAEIYNEAILTTTATFDTEPKPVEERELWLRSHNERHPVLVAVVDGRVVGWASLTAWSDRPAYADTAETSFYVHSTQRGHGIGRKLKEAIIAEAPGVPGDTTHSSPASPRAARRASTSMPVPASCSWGRSRKSDASLAGFWMSIFCR